MGVLRPALPTLDDEAVRQPQPNLSLVRSSVAPIPHQQVISAGRLVREPPCGRAKGGIHGRAPGPEPGDFLTEHSHTRLHGIPAAAPEVRPSTWWI